MTMKHPRINYFAVGVFVLAMLATFIVAVALLSGPTGVVDRYHTYYNNVTGVLPGTQLMLEGFPVGQVERIDPSDDPSKGRYRVTFAVDRGWPIPEDSVAWITEPGLLAAITIDIHAGSSEVMLEPGSEIQGRDLQSVFTFVATLAGEVQALLEGEVRPLLEAVAGSTPEILGNLEKVTQDLAVATEQVALLLGPDNARRAEGMIEDFSATASNLAELTTHLESSLAQVDEMIAGMHGLVAENRGEVSRAIRDLEHTIAAIASRVDTITSNLEATSHNMNEFSGQIRRNPAVLLRGNVGGDDVGGRP